MAAGDWTISGAFKVPLNNAQIEAFIEAGTGGKSNSVVVFPVGNGDFWIGCLEGGAT